MAKGKIHNKKLGQSTYNDEYIDEKFDELTPVDGVLFDDDVVDNLTSTEQKKPLSANQGRVLNTTKSNLDSGNILTGSQSIVDNRNQVRRYTTMDSIGVQAQDDQAGKSVGFNAHGISFEDHNKGTSHSLEVEDGVLLFDGEPIGTGEGGGGDGKHQRIDAYPEEEYNQGQFWKIVSDSYQFRQDQLYVVDIEISNQGGSSRGTLFIGLADHGEGIIHHTSGQYLYSVEWHIENGEIQFHSIQAGNNGFSLYSVIHIGTGGGAVAGKIFNLERFEYSAASLTYVGWRREDGGQLEEGVKYTVKGAYYGDPFEVTLDEYGWADLPNGMGIQLLNRMGMWILEGGNRNNYQGIEIFSAAEPGAIAIPEVNFDVIQCLWQGERVIIRPNENLMSMTGQIQYEMTMLDIPNSIDLEELENKLILDDKLFAPMEEMFGMSQGDIYNSMEWMFQEIHNYCEQYGEFDLNNVYDWNVYGYLQEIMETLAMVDMINPKLMSLKMTFMYACSNSMTPLEVLPIGTAGIKGANTVLVPYIKKLGENL